MRGVLGVLIGAGVMLLTRFLPFDNIAASISGTVALAILAGFVTALIAGRNEFRYAGMLGVVMVALAVLGMRSRGARQPGWEEVAIGGCGPLASFVGAGLWLLSKPRGK